MQKLTDLQYIELFESRGYKLLSIPKNTKDKVECFDKNGYKYLSSYEQLRDTRTKELAKFKKNNPFKPYNMRLFVSLNSPNGEILMSDEELFYTKGKTILFRCPICFNHFDSKWEHYTTMERKWCPACNRTKAQEDNKLCFKHIQEVFSNANLTLLSSVSEYKNRSTRLSCMNEDGYKFAVKVDSIKNGVFNGTEKYAGHNPFALSNIEHYIKLNNIDAQAVKRVNQRKWQFRCSCGKLFEITLTKFLEGYVRCHGCVCTDSKYSILVRKWLDTHNISYIKEHRFADCRNKKPLPFDFAIEQGKGKWILIEVDGEQHFYTTPWTSEKDLANQKKRDKIKDAYCQEKGHTLIRLPFWKINSGTYEHILTQNLLA